jgi:endonuclease YncB( thermonuclease family)
MGRIGWWAMIAALAALCACGPKMDGLTAGETGKVASVSDGDTLTLDTGLKVQLTGIIAPRRGFGDRPDEPKANEARQTLEKLALGRAARLGYGGTKRFKETTALAQVFVQTEGGRWVWLQDAMIREGMARARTWKDNRVRYQALYADEARARAEKKGLWKEKFFAVRGADNVRAGDGGFQIVEGAVKSVGVTKKKTYLNFGDDYRTDFTVGIDAEDLPNWTAKDTPLAALKGRRIRVRGYVYDAGGPMIYIDHPQAIEIVK